MAGFPRPRRPLPGTANRGSGGQAGSRPGGREPTPRAAVCPADEWDWDPGDLFRIADAGQLDRWSVGEPRDQ